MKRKTVAIVILLLVITCFSPAIVSEAAGALIKAKGEGFAPARIQRPNQARLLARRAAIVDAYRNLLRALNDASGHIPSVRAYIEEDGFIRGAQILDEVTYPDGKVEVEVGLAVDLKGFRRLSRGTISRPPNGSSSSADRRQTPRAKRRCCGGA